MDKDECVPIEELENILGKRLQNESAFINSSFLFLISASTRLERRLSKVESRFIRKDVQNILGEDVLSIDSTKFEKILDKNTDYQTLSNIPDTLSGQSADSY